MAYHYRYCLITADVDYHINTHPQQQMKKLGFHVVKSEPVPIADCWWFRTSNTIQDIPNYITPMPNEFKFSDEYRRTR